MRGFEQYLRTVEALAAQVWRDPDSVEPKALDRALNGDATKALRKGIDLTARKQVGAFFTGEKLADRAVVLALRSAKKPTRLATLDPACGAGDLLLAYARVLPLERDLSSTLSRWASLLHGNDIAAQFVRAAKARLVLAAYARGAKPNGPAPEVLLPGLRRQDALKVTALADDVEHILVNPPFVAVIAPESCSWGAGRVSSAAVFMDHLLTLAESRTRITAILPDVLRTGTNYERWRALVRDRMHIEEIQVYGSFDDEADVDVFLLTGYARRPASRRQVSWGWQLSPAAIRTFGDLFTVSTGSVVPHRDREKGARRRYLHAKDAPKWGTVRRVRAMLRSEKTVHHPPFIAIRRTSSPSDRERAIGTIILGKKPVVVENHLLVLQPTDRRMDTCQAGLRKLRDHRTTKWLNQRIRCRHLTVSALRQLPWHSDEST